MRADVAVGQRAEDRVANGVDQHIGIGMADEALMMRHFDAAEPDGRAGSEGVHVVALSGADVWRQEARFGGGEIGGRGDLHIGGISGEDMNPMAGPFGDGAVVGQVVDSGHSGAGVGVGDQVEIESLRRLHGAQRRARRRGDHEACRVHLFQRVGGRRAGHGGGVGARCGDRAFNQDLGCEGAGSVMNQNDLRMRFT